MEIVCLESLKTIFLTMDGQKYDRVQLPTHSAIVCIEEGLSSWNPLQVFVQVLGESEYTHINYCYINPPSVTQVRLDAKGKIFR